MPKGRPRQFDETEALRKATLVFWQRGYRGTSLDDLTEAMGINKPSLYSAFGDKEQLFLNVIDHYRDQFIRPRASVLFEAQTLREGLNRFLSSMSELVASGETPPGCLVACLLAEECCESDVIRMKLNDIIHGADTVFAKVFEMHKDELVSALTPHMAARLLTTALHGIAIRARSGADQSELAEVAKSFCLAVLR